MTAFRRLLISARAKNEIREAKRWWRRERSKAPSALGDELRAAFGLLREFPMAGRPIDDELFVAVRRLSLNRTHYYLFYEIRDAEIVIIGLRHQSRDAEASRE
jgi:plasmid stabilization system protein ParE